jgi:hypothetical protein
MCAFTTEKSDRLTRIYQIVDENQIQRNQWKKTDFYARKYNSTQRATVVSKQIVD